MSQVKVCSEPAGGTCDELAEPGPPERCVEHIVDFYGETDRGSFRLEEVQKAQAERDSLRGDYLEVD